MLQFTGFSCLIWGPKLYTGCCHRQQLFRQYIASRSTQTVWDFVQRQKYHWCVIYMMLYTNALHFKWLHYDKIAQTFIIHNNQLRILWEVITDTQTGMLLKEKRNMRSKIWWLTEFCNSHYVSHFAAFFIVARAKISVAESCFSNYIDDNVVYNII